MINLNHKKCFCKVADRGKCLTLGWQCTDDICDVQRMITKWRHRKLLFLERLRNKVEKLHDNKAEKELRKDIKTCEEEVKRLSEIMGVKQLGKSPTEAEIYNNPFIKHIRVALNGYLDGNNQGVDDYDFTSTVNGPDGLPNYGLKKFDKAYYKSKFIVLNASDNNYGGVQADIVFVNRPDTIFCAWVYKLAGGEYTLRGFCPNDPTEDKKAYFADYMKGIIKESKFSL